MSTEITKFEVNRTYECRSACDSNCIWTFVVARRTPKQVVLVDGDLTEIRVGIREYNGAETCFPLGKYSMAPMLRAA